MNSASNHRFIDRIPTELSGVLRAIDRPVPHPRIGDDVETCEKLRMAREVQLQAREQFLKRYQPAILAFIVTILKDQDAISSVWDAFVDKWLNGRLAGFRPETGSFRKYLKTILRNDCRSYWMKHNEAMGEKRLDTSYEQHVSLQNSAGIAFDRELKQEVLRRAQHAVAQKDARYHDIIEFLTANSGTGSSSEELAHYLFTRMGEEVTVAHARQLKHRAKEMYTQEIIAQVSLTLDSHNLVEIEDALAELSLLQFCRSTLQGLKASM